MTRLLLLVVVSGEGTPIQDAVDGAGGDTIYVHAAIRGMWTSNLR